MKRIAAVVPAAVILLLNLWLNAPLFMAGELPFRGSIEGGYVGMARFFAQHPNPWGWNPLSYCGLPAQFMYVPLVPYLTALWIRMLPAVPPDAIYRTIVSLPTCLGPVTLYFFALYFMRSKRAAFATALAYSFISPSYALFPAVETDRGVVQLPWRIQVLAKYGEGPHNTALALLPLALLALWIAARSRGYPRILVAAVTLAIVPLTNWVGAFSLAIASLLMLLAAWGEPEFRAWRVVAAGLLAYLLACFWLTPSFIRTIAFNWPTDSFAYHLGREQALLIAGLAAGALVIRAVFYWLRGPFYLSFVTLAAFAFGWIATVFYIYGIDTIPESRRYAIEFELFLVLALVEGFRVAYRSTNSTVRLCAVATVGVMLLVGSPQVWAYVTQGWNAWRPSPPASTIEFRLAEWMAQHPPEGRVFATGGMRFRLNQWADLPQVGGGFETGLQNRTPVKLAYDIRSGAGDMLPKLEALGASYLVVHGPKSREYYRDFVHPERATALQAVYHVEDDTIYAVPNRGIAHLVRQEELQSLERYAAAIEDVSRPALRLRWAGSTATIDGPIPAGYSVSLQVNDDPGWHAIQAGREIPKARDELGFILLAPAPAPYGRIELQYRGTGEQKAFAAVSGVAWIGALLALFAGRRGGTLKVPAWHKSSVLIKTN